MYLKSSFSFKVIQEVKNDLKCNCNKNQEKIEQTFVSVTRKIFHTHTTYIETLQ